MLCYVFLSEGKHLLIFIVQLYLIFENVSVMFKLLTLLLHRRVEIMVRLWITAYVNTVVRVVLINESYLY